MRQLGFLVINYSELRRYLKVLDFLDRQGTLNLQDWKMTDNKCGGLENTGQENDRQHNRGWKMRDLKLTDKSAAGKNVEHVVLTFKNHRTKLINVHDFGVSVSSTQSS